MTTSLAKFLVDFSEAEPPRGAAVASGLTHAPGEDPVALRIEDARRQASEEARGQAEQALAAVRAEHAEHLAEARRRWTEGEGDRIAAALSEGLAALEKRLADAVAELLEPLVLEAVRRKAAGDLSETLAGVLANADDVAIMVRGPDDLIAAIQSGYAGAARLQIQTSETGDAVIRAGDTHIRTQLEAWTERLRLNLRAQP